MVEDPILPRGRLLFEMDPSSRAITGLYQEGPEGGRELGRGFLAPELGAARIPELVPVEARFRALADDAAAPPIRLGTTRGRFSGDEQSLPLRLSYGVFSRLTVGVTVPFVRRRVDALVRFGPEEANVGRTPAQSSPAVVSSFLAQAQAALGEVSAAVAATCAEAGETDPACLDGMALIEEAGAFLQSLESTYEEESLFPLEGSGLGARVAGRWSALDDRIRDWGAEGPGDLPLAADPLGDEAFRSLFLGPAWPGSGFPLESPPAFLELGDVELHLALQLFDLEGGGAIPEGSRFRSAIVGTVRFPTGQLDSLRAVAPIDPPRGVGGTELRWVSDLLMASRFGLLGVLEAGWSGERDMVLLAPDPDRLFSPGHTRAAVRWQPGTHLRMSLTPRVHVGPPLSVGAGWHLLRRAADTFQPLDPTGTNLPAPAGPFVQHRLALELRYVALGGPIEDVVRMPFELLLRASRSVAGSGEWAPVERRIEASARFPLRR